MLTSLGKKILVANNKVINQVEHIEDCKKIKQVLYDNGYDLTLNEVEELWYEISGEASASWLDADNEEKIKYWLGIVEENHEDSN